MLFMGTYSFEFSNNPSKGQFNDLNRFSKDLDLSGKYLTQEHIRKKT